jgi:zinc-ribbon domain
MFCDQCGIEIQPGQKFCNRCGKEIRGFIAGYPMRSRLQEHLRLLAILWFAFAGMNALGGLVLVTLANTLFVHLPEMGAPPQTVFLHPLLTMVGSFVLVKGMAGFVAGWGLLHREPWARVLTLVLAFLSLINIPFGTALGVYTLWVLLPAQSEDEYAKFRRSAVA